MYVYKWTLCQQMYTNIDNYTKSKFIKEICNIVRNKYTTQAVDIGQPNGHSFLVINVLQ